MSASEWRLHLREIASRTSARQVSAKFSGIKREIKPSEAVETFVSATSPARVA